MSVEHHPVQGKASLLLLKTVPLFNGLPEVQLEQIAKIAISRTVPKHTTIVHAGEHTDAFFIIVAGSAKIVNRNEEGQEVILAMIGAGDCFGEMGMIDGSPRSADVVADDNCALIMITKVDFMALLATNFDLCHRIMKNLVERLREANRKIESLALLDVYGRVAKLLLDFSELENGLRVVKRKVTKQDIAKMVGASREMVSRVMRDLENNGYIRTEKGKIVLAKD